MTPPTNRKPDPGTGIIYIDLDQSTPIWVGTWADLGDGLDIFADDDLRVVVEWAQRQPAVAKLFSPLEQYGFVDLDDFLAEPEKYLHWEYRPRWEGHPQMDSGEGVGWVGQATDEHMRAAMEALDRGDTTAATLHMMASFQATLSALHWEVRAINLREGRNDYPPEAEPYFDKAMRFAEAGEYEKSIAYGILNIGALMDAMFPRMDEITHLLRRPRDA
ncbi:hypothetical protein [Actinopolymorpha alba]|uniref:hypothetical protein n=1 Tax=Actinopolymorpha alba TaxID=533267 RepID=UPI0012F6BF62|nr:hypothetical protein [Actinopolymorpha alba]